MGDGVYRAFYRHLELGKFDSAELKFYPRFRVHRRLHRPPTRLPSP
jgi:hypothetical protein